MSRARWGEYRTLLARAVDEGYAVRALEDWLTTDAPERPVLVLRHDVDQHPRSVLPVLEIERALGITSTWYFRWRTADRRVIEAVQAAGGNVGLHYETLTRRILRDGGEPTPALIDECRAELRREIEAFKQLFGSIRSVCPHGDSRVPGVRNQVLLQRVDLAEFGIEFDGNAALHGRRLGMWLTDRSSADGGWMDGVDPLELLSQRVEPILCITHPNNLASGAGLWADRIASGLLPTPRPGSRVLVRRTTRDDPPAVAEGAPVPSASEFAPLADALADAVRRHYEKQGDNELTGDTWLNTLLTNSSLAERRVDTLLTVLLEHSDITSLDGLRVLDMGCGFGAPALVFASKGADVIAMDPKAARFEVGKSVARQFGLPVTFRRGWMEESDLGVSEFDLVVLNNSFCYLIDPEQREDALRRVARALRPGGWLVMRNPNRLHPIDQFTGLPLVGMLPPRGAAAVARVFRRRRSRVRLQSVWSARRELRAAGFTDIAIASPRPERVRRGLLPFARYQHLVARSERA